MQLTVLERICVSLQAFIGKQEILKINEISIQLEGIGRRTADQIQGNKKRNHNEENYR